MCSTKTPLLPESTITALYFKVYTNMKDKSGYCELRHIVN